MKQASLYSTPHQVLINLLKDLRLLARLTQTNVALALGRPQSYLSNIERGQRGLDLFQVEELAQLYGYDLRSFVELLADRKKAAASLAGRRDDKTPVSPRRARAAKSARSNPTRKKSRL